MQIFLKEIIYGQNTGDLSQLTVFQSLLGG